MSLTIYEQKKNTEIKSTNSRNISSTNSRNISDINKDHTSSINENYKNIIKNKFIEPLYKELDNAFIQIQKINDNKKENSKQMYKKIVSYKKDLEENIKKLRNIMISSSIVSSQFSSLINFSIKLEKGIQLKIRPETENYDIFFDIVRKYVFQYKEYYKWPPTEENYNFFMEGDTKELCCFYWPLYGFVKNIIHNDFKENNILLFDLYSLQKMNTYCMDFFSKGKTSSTTNIIIKGKNKKKEGRKYGGDKQSNSKQSNPKQSNSKQSNPKQSNPKQSNSRQSNPKQSNSRQSNPKQSNSRQIDKPIFESTKQCNTTKLNEVRQALKNTKIYLENKNVSQSINGIKVELNEFQALENIVKIYIRKNISDEGVGLFVNNYSINDFLNKYKKNDAYDIYLDKSKLDDRNYLYDNFKDIKLTIEPDTPVFVEPFTKSIFRYKDIQYWFPESTIKSSVNTGTINKKTSKSIYKEQTKAFNTYPLIVISRAIKKFKDNYKLLSLIL